MVYMEYCSSLWFLCFGGNYLILMVIIGYKVVQLLKYIEELHLLG
jgi:hypothetical protein